MNKAYTVLAILINLFFSNTLYSQLSDDPKLNEESLYQEYRKMILDFDQNRITVFAAQRGFGVSQIIHLGDRQYSITYINPSTGRILKGGTYNGNQNSVISFEEFKEKELLKREEERQRELKQKQMEYEKRQLEKIKREQDSTRISNEIIRIGKVFNENLKTVLNETEEKELNKYLRKFSKSAEELPQFKNCTDNSKECFQENMIKIISENFVYPKRGIEEEVQAKFTFIFVINEKGLIENLRFKIETSPDLEPDNDLILDFINNSLSILTKMPVLFPAILNGSPSRIPFSMPITYKLTH